MFRWTFGPLIKAALRHPEDQRLLLRLARLGALGALAGNVVGQTPEPWCRLLILLAATIYYLLAITKYHALIFISYFQEDAITLTKGSRDVSW